MVYFQPFDSKQVQLKLPPLKQGTRTHFHNKVLDPLPQAVRLSHKLGILAHCIQANGMSGKWEKLKAVACMPAARCTRLLVG